LYQWSHSLFNFHHSISGHGLTNEDSLK